MKHRMKIAMIILLISSVVFSSCATEATKEQSDAVSNTVSGGVSEELSEPKVAQYNKITPKVAKQMIDEGNVIILDVRTQSEYDQLHIKDAVLLPDYEVADRAGEVLPDNEAVILVYCRSGNRSESAARTLVSLGYTNVYDFGGIIDWPYDELTEST